MTALSRAFLRQQHWSPVKRTPTEWPSLLALAPGGWTVSAMFALAGLSAFSLALALKQVGNRSSTLVAYCLVIAGLGLVGVAFPADLPSAAGSWHGYVHNTMYNLIPVGVGLSMLARAAWGNTVTGRRAPDPLAMISLGLLSAFIGLTLLDSIAQLARYGVLATMLGWVMSLAIDSIQLARSEQTPAGFNGTSRWR